MGNQLAQPQRLHPEQLAELPNVVFKDTLGGGRLLKTVLCVHDVGALVVKVYNTRGEPVDLKPYEEHLTKIRDRLMSVPRSHLWPFQVFVQNETRGFLVRPYIDANLYDRMSTRPFLNSIEKRWLAFQLLHALKQCHGKGVCHGDVKCENVLVTSWNWVLLTDFASYKPVHLPADNPADFSYYFDIGSRRRCYVAPERFFEGSGESPKGVLLPSMDIFSAGCVIAELFLDGRALFDLSQLLSYREGDYSVEHVLAGIDPRVRELVQHMIQLDPGSRLSATDYLESYTKSVFPEYFEDALHPFFGSVLASSPDARVLQLKAQFQTLKGKIMGMESNEVPSKDPSEPAQVRSSEKDALDSSGRYVVSTSSPAAGPSAYMTAGQSGNLLEEVGALLSDVQQTQSQVLKMSNPGEHQGGDSEGMFLGDSIGSITGIEQTNLVSDGYSQVQEVVTEEIHQYQFRESGGKFVEVANSQSTLIPQDATHQFRQKGDVQLPKEGGWQWASDWEVDLRGNCDSDGWSYKGGPSGVGNWDAECNPRSVTRRRRWVRKRTRRRELRQAPANARAHPPDFELPENLDSAPVSEGMVMILVLLCTLVRGSKLQESRRCAVALLYRAAIHCDDECRIQRAVPHLLSLVSDPSASIRALALHYLIKIFGSVQNIPASDARIFQDYILPSLSLLPNDPEELVRVEYAAGIPRLTASAGRYLGRGTKEVSALSFSNTEPGPLWKKIETVLYELGAGDKGNANTRRAILERATSLPDFFGRNSVSELLMVLFTFLNDADWRLWASFFACVKDLVAKSGSHTVDKLTPFLEQGLQHTDPSVVSNSLDLLCHICIHARLRKCLLLQMCQKVVPMLRDRNACVRARSIDFLVIAARVLSPADAFARLLPLVRNALTNVPDAPVINLGVLSSPSMMVDLLKVLPPVKKSEQVNRGSSNGGSQMGVSHGKFEEDEVLDAKAPIYSLSLDKRLLQCGLTRHRAALEGWKKETENTTVHSGGDVRSEATLLTWGIVQMADKLPVHTSTSKLGSIPSTAHYIDVPPGTSSPWVRNQMAEALNTPLSTSAPMMSLDPSAVWRPRGVLIAHLAEHRRAVNCLSVAGKDRHNPFFVSASNDGTVKVWDLRHLERDVNFHSRLTYGAQDGKILSVTTCEDGKSVASASSNGSIHVWRVQYAQDARSGAREEYSGITSQQKLCPSEGAILEIKQWGPLLLYVTQRGGVHAWDTRMKRDAWVLPVTPRLGLVEHMALDPSDRGMWLLTGSSRGYLALWDARFHLQVNGWRHPSGAPVDALSTAIAPADWLGARGYSGSGPLVYVLSGGNEVGLWDVEEGRCRQVLRVIPREETEVGKMEKPAALQAPQTPRNPIQLSQMLPGDPMRMGFARDLAIPELYMPQPRSEGIRAVFPLSYGGVLTGGSDACVRLWDGQEPKQSYVVCGPSVTDRKRFEEGHPHIQYKYQYSHHMLHEVSIIDECCLPTHMNAPTVTNPFENIVRMDDNCHKDCITGVAMAEVSERMLLTCGRDGVVKAWR